MSVGVYADEKQVTHPNRKGNVVSLRSLAVRLVLLSTTALGSVLCGMFAGWRW
jgi:hypothetical protein